VSMGQPDDSLPVWSAGWAGMHGRTTRGLTDTVRLCECNSGGLAVTNRRLSGGSRPSPLGTGVVEPEITSSSMTMAELHAQ